MGIIPKYSKECPTCTRRYPSTCGVANCLACKDPLAQTQKEPTVTEEEFKALSFIYGRTIPGPLSPEDREAWDAEWRALEDEADRRAPWFSEADLFAEGFRRPSESSS